MLIYIAPLVKEYQIDCVHFAENLRNKGFNVVINYTKYAISGHLKSANKQHASYMIIYGENEELTKTVLVKNLNKELKKIFHTQQ